MAEGLMGGWLMADGRLVGLAYHGMGPDAG